MSYFILFLSEVRALLRSLCIICSLIWDKILSIDKNLMAIYLFLSMYKLLLFPHLYQCLINQHIKICLTIKFSSSSNALLTGLDTPGLGLSSTFKRKLDGGMYSILFSET